MRQREAGRSKESKGMKEARFGVCSVPKGEERQGSREVSINKGCVRKGKARLD